MKLIVPSSGGGEEEGLNDPGVELFLGSVEQNLARESAQNAIDAAATSTAVVELTFELVSIPTAEIPCGTELATVMRQCAEFWSQDRKSSEFFAKAQRVLKQENLQVLRISDHGTTGLTGGDADRSGRWYGLVRSAGVSNKAEGAGGSFGIGKFAPFAASEIRTVFYSTQVGGGPVAFQGIMRLASHRDQRNEITRRTGYIGMPTPDGSCSAVRDVGQIPMQFRRSEPGTSIYVAGYRIVESWEHRLIASVLSSFWPAIHRNIIAFRVGDRRITAATLEADLKVCSGDDEFDAHVYYRALFDGQRHETNIANLGPVVLHLLASDEELPKRVALTRKTGMIIDLKQFRSRKPFCGYLVCESPEGNELLRSLEPPRHNEWNPSRGTKEAAKALKDLYDWIREKIKDLNPVPTDQALDVPDLARYLPFDEEADQLVPDAAGAVPETQFTPKTPIRRIEVRPTAVSPPRVLEPTREGGEKESDGGTGPGTGGAGGGEGNAATDHEGVGTGAGGGEGHDPSRTPTKKPKLDFRSFQRSDGAYVVVLRSVGGAAKGFQLVSVGEDGRSEAQHLKSARDAETGVSLPVSGTRVTASLTSKRSKRFVVEFQTQLRLALAAEAI